MSKTGDNIACPICGSELTLAQLMASEDTQRAFARLASVSVPMGSRVLSYITLFAPPKTRLTVPKQVRLILQLLPDLERAVISHRGRDWAAPRDAWASAIDQMLAARDAGRLELPMKGHGYLYAILAGMADKVEGVAERQSEAERRSPPPQPFVADPQGPAYRHYMREQYGGKDPAIFKLDADARNAAPMPDAVRQRIEALRRGPKGDQA